MYWLPEDLIISIHAPREGERREDVKQMREQGEFQSTLPARGSDNSLRPDDIEAERISIHAPREGERPPLSTKNRQVVTISIHAPREGERRYDIQSIVCY